MSGGDPGAGETPAEVARALSRLRRELRALPDRVLRQHRIADRMRALPADVAVAVMAALWRGASARDPLFQELLLDLATTRPLEESLGYERVRALYERAVEAGEPQVARLFFGHAAAVAALDPDRENEKLASEPLGRRRALARGRDRMKLDRLLFDRNPMVARNLLQNPRLVERDVVRMAAMRPTDARILEEIHRHPRWIGAYAVKKALVLNPYTPVDIATSLLVHLLKPDLWRAARDPTLHAAVREAAGELLRARGIAPRPLDPPRPPEEERPSRQEVLRALYEARRAPRAPPEYAPSLSREDLERALGGVRRSASDADGTGEE